MNDSAKDCIHGCGVRISPNSELEECPKCRQGFYYWRKKSAKDRLERRNKLDVLSSRLDTHFDTRGKQNTEPHVQPPPQETRSKVVITRERRK